MNKTQLVDALAARMGDRRSAATAVDGLLETIVDTVTAGDSVSITGFGVFEPRARAARVARNPRTGETVDVPATTVPAFRPGASFRTAVSGSGAPAPRSVARRPRAAAAPAPASTASGAATATSGASFAAATAPVKKAAAAPKAKAKASAAKAASTKSTSAKAAAPKEKARKAKAKK